MGEKKEKLTPKEIQMKEESARSHLRELYQRQDAYWRDRYFKGLEEANRIVTSQYMGPKMDPNTVPNPNGATLAVKDNELLEIGTHEVTVALLDEHKNEKEKRTYTLKVTPDGIQVTNLDEASAGMDLYAGKGRADTIVLSVSATPNYPKDAADDLVAWARLCITKKLAAELSQSSGSFLSNKEYQKDVSPERIQEIRELIAISKFALAETTLNATMSAGTQPSWLPGDTQILDEQAQKSDDFITKTRANASFDDKGNAQVAAVEWKDFLDRVKQLELTRDRLAKVEAAERAILTDPDMLVKARQLSSQVNTHDAAKDISTKTREKLAEIKNVPQDKMDQVIQSVTDNNTHSRGPKEKLILAMEKELQALRQEQIRLQSKFTPEKFGAQHAELQKEQKRINDSLGQTGKLATDIGNMKIWNSVDGSRDALIASKRPQPPVQRTPGVGGPGGGG